MIRGKILFVSDECYYYSQGLTVFKKNIYSKEVSTFIKLPARILDSFVSRQHLLSRLFRSQVHHMVDDGQGGFFIVFLKRIVKVDSLGNIVGVVASLVGSRPLCVTVYNGKLLFGEYTNNSERKSVGIYSFNGNGLELVCSVNGVRHIHGVFVDDTDKSIYVTTGDYGDEAGIWKLDYDSAKLQPIYIGGQQARAVELLFDESSIYFGTDTPLEKNYIYKLDKKTRNVVPISDVSSSVFYAKKRNKKFYFGTVAEPSQVNTQKALELWEVYDGNAKLINTFDKDIWSMKYFQYGQIVFPNYSMSSKTSELWFYQLATKKSGVSNFIVSKK